MKTASLRFLIENLVRECHGFNAYMALACSSAMTTYREGLRLGLITPEEFDKGEKDYGRLWNYVGD